MEDGEWNSQALRSCIAEETVLKILATPAPRPSDPPDTLAWKHTSDGRFSVKSAYKFLSHDLPSSEGLSHYQQINVSWTPPLRNWVKVNTDGAYKATSAKRDVEIFSETVKGSVEKSGLTVLAIVEFISLAGKNGKSISVSFYEVDHQDHAVDLLNPGQPPIL
ncbi:hypothetical protein PIB30_043834 [Stylosanthes scabra]|uniref:Uncharacterized protein n=1 Tax=Stylosanthes scabra TaxID=79078 RepID=A0ABU6WE15_9FABA|nr:hypothetical protein [Stylosanthes scabra]